MIAIATIGLSFLTQQGAKLLGIELPEQTNIEIVKRCLAQAFASWRAFGVAALLVAQVLVIMPVIEELVFRWGLFRGICRLVSRRARGSRPTEDELRRARGSCPTEDESLRARGSRPTEVGADAPGGPQRGEDVRREVRDASGDKETQKTFRPTAVDLLSPPAFLIPSLPAFLIALVSSALFSAAHYIAQPWPDNAFLALFLFGLAQCWLYRRTQRLWCAMTNHFLFNLTNLVLLFVV